MLTVKELLEHFPEDFMVDIRTPICRIRGKVEDILSDDFARDIWINKWRVTNKDVLQIDN